MPLASRTDVSTYIDRYTSWGCLGHCELAWAASLGIHFTTLWMTAASWCAQVFALQKGSNLTVLLNDVGLPPQQHMSGGIYGMVAGPLPCPGVPSTRLSHQARLVNCLMVLLHRPTTILVLLRWDI